MSLESKYINENIYSPQC
jgi:hypothetical protein